MTDLQCPATLLLVPAGRAEAAGDLGGNRIAHVWTSSGAAAQATAGSLAAGLGVGVTARDDLRGGQPAATVLAEIADEHRGETVLVVVDEGEAVVEVALDGDGAVTRP